MFSMRRQS